MNAGLAAWKKTAPAISWADRQAADRRRTLRVRVQLHRMILERLRAMGIDPTHIAAVQSGEEAAAELAAIPDTPELERADEVILRAEYSNSGDGARHFRGEITRMAELYVLVSIG